MSSFVIPSSILLILLVERVLTQLISACDINNATNATNNVLFIITIPNIYVFYN